MERNINSAQQPLISSSTISAAVTTDNGGGDSQVTLSYNRSSITIDDDDQNDEEGDIPPIKTLKMFFKVFWKELKKTMYLAAPATFMRTCQYSLGAITITLSGHLGTLDLAAFSIENSVIAGFSLGFLLGMGSALETLCGQAFGAKQLNMLGIYLQRSWVILNTTALLLCLFYIFATPLLKFIGETSAISEAAGKVALWMIPQLFAYAMVFPIIKYLQAQRKVMTMAAITGVALLLHAFFSWLIMLKLGWGLVGGAAVLNTSWWFIVLAELVYIFSGRCGEAWTGFSWKAFNDLWGFFRLSVASAVMLCLETWYFMALILFAGYLENAEVSVDALSVCMNILGWAMMVALGFNAAVSVRVSNELGAGRPRTAKFSVLVSVAISFMVGLILSSILLIYRKEYPAIFTSSKDVQHIVTKLTPILTFSITINNFQPVLSGVAVGAGWQALVAYINIGCYYIFGIPLGLSLGYLLGLGVQGIWLGMLSGTCVQTIILFLIVWKTNWNKEASVAEERIRLWGGPQYGNA
ncbi:protein DETOXIFICATION 30-like isoform X1 [Amaranthus tricolor]|uniref:protein DETOXIFICATION 30-like isoform X1 n=1 Tax=Amaranthus tricolor TaxID=29722 RepID=UPI00258DAC35|nr:protein DETOXIFICATION 30-like isoform X1 [Amaranthus tricolor]